METYVIHVTKECNCACTYCYEQDKTSKYSWDEIKKLLDDILEHKTGKFTIEFLGGEPLMAFDHIKRAVAYFGSGVDFTITTNGTILTDEIVLFLKDNPNVRFSASLDGHRYANFMRVFKEGDKCNTYDKVIKNLQWLQREGIEFSVHMVTHPYNVAFLSDSIDHLYKLGVRNIGVGTVESTITITQSYCDRFIEELGIVSEKIHAGEYPGLHVGELEGVKPYTDTRTYIRDESGKVVGESYGRAGDDITHTNLYNFQKCSEKTAVSEMIYHIRRTVYENHQSKSR